MTNLVALNTAIDWACLQLRERGFDMWLNPHLLTTLEAATARYEWILEYAKTVRVAIEPPPHVSERHADKLLEQAPDVPHPTATTRQLSRPLGSAM